MKRAVPRYRARTRRALATASALLAVSALAGCGGCGDAGSDGARGGQEAPTDAPAPAAAAPVITRLTVRDATPEHFRPVALPAETLDALARETLSGSGLHAGSRSPERWSMEVGAQLVYGLVTDDGLAAEVAPGPLRVVCQIEARLRAPGQSERVPIEAQGAYEGPYAGAADALPAALEAGARQAMTVAATELAAQAEVFGWPPERLIGALEDTSPAVRRAATGRLAMLRHAPAVPALAKRAKVEPERALKLRTVGALAEIGDDGAATALIDLANPKDRELLQAVLDALSVVGGERVEDFFEILSAHDSAEVRTWVEAARARLAQRRGARVGERHGAPSAERPGERR